MPRRRKDPDFDPDEFYGGPSKSQLKRDALELQELGAALEELPQDKVDAIEMGERLREALRELKRLKLGEARRRHLQFIGKLLREEDPEPFRRALTEHRSGLNQATQAFKELERWRERLLTEPDALDAWLAAYPASDTPDFRAALARARRERAEDEAAGRRSKGPHFRELFQVLREAMRGNTASG